MTLKLHYLKEATDTLVLRVDKLSFCLACCTGRSPIRSAPLKHYVADSTALGLRTLKLRKVPKRVCTELHDSQFTVFPKRLVRATICIESGKCTK